MIVTAADRAFEAHNALSRRWKGNALSYEWDGLRVQLDAQPGLIRNKRGDMVGIDAWVRLFDKAGAEKPCDPHRRCVNPPLQVVDQARQLRDGKRVLKLDPEAAFWEWLVFNVLETPNPRGWRTRGTVTTVYGDASDDAIISGGDTTYAHALAGTGSLFSVYSTWNGNNDEVTVGQEQYLGKYYCYLGYVSYDTSVIADTDVISAVANNLRGKSAAAIGTACTLQARAYNFGASVTTADWRTNTQFAALTLLASLASASWSMATYNALTENGTNFKSAINKTGTTYVCYSTDRFAGANVPSTQEYFVWYSADNAGTTLDPKLVITSAAPVTIRRRTLNQLGTRTGSRAA